MVKNILLAFSVFIASSAYGSTESSRTLSASQEHEILLTLNNICGDAWCEGPFDIQFLSLQDIEMSDFFALEAMTTADPTDPSTATSIPFRCKIPTLTIAKLVAADSSDSLFEAEVELFQEVSRCIDTALYTKN